MSYIEKNLMTDERVMYRAHQHWIRLAGPAATTLIMLVLGGLFWVALGIAWLGMAFLAFALVSLVHFTARYVHARSLELCVTNKRVLVKSGIISQQSIEILLSKVEAIVVEQTLLGRLFNYGSVSVGGTGGTKEHFHYIHAPHEFRSKVHEQTAS